MHDAQSAFRWSMPHHFKDADLLKNVWISIASIRQSFDAIGRYLLEWIYEVFKFVRPWGDEEAAHWKLLWETLGIDETTVALLVHLQLRFCDGCLYLSSDCEGDPNITNTLSTAVLAVWRFKKYPNACGEFRQCASATAQQERTLKVIFSPVQCPVWTGACLLRRIAVAIVILKVPIRFFFLIACPPPPHILYGSVEVPPGPHGGFSGFPWGPTGGFLGACLGFAGGSSGTSGPSWARPLRRVLTHRFG
eukprot:3900073-Pyramimonas_sp.AAC.1